MRMGKMLKKGILHVILAMVMLICQIVTVSAVGVDQMPDLEEGKKGTLSVTLSYKEKDDKKIYIEGVTLEIFKVADLSVINGGAATYTLTSEFAKSKLALEGMSASESIEAAEILEQIVKEKSLKGQAAVSGKDGKVVYKDLEPGMYLVMQTANAVTVPEYTKMETYLVSVPLGEVGTENTWNYEVKSYPKTEIGKQSALGSIEVIKKVSFVQDGEYVPLNGIGVTFYAGLFIDAEGTMLYEKDAVLPIQMGSQSVGKVTFTDLPKGTYYVFETTEDGKAIKPGEMINDGFASFMCLAEGSQKIVLNPEKNKQAGPVIFNNVYEELPDGYFVDAEVEIQKSVFKGKDRVVVADTFYAGIFTEVEGEYFLSQLVELKQNETVTLPIMLAGEKGTEAAVYWVYETDSEGTPIDKALFAYEVSGEGKVTLSKENPKAQIEIVNKIKETEPEETEKDTEKETEQTTESETENKVVETGDDSPVEIYIALILTAVIVMVAELIRKRKVN